MRPAILTLSLVLTVGNLAHCQDWENLLFIKMEEVLEKQEAALSQLKRQEAALSQLKEERLKFSTEVQEKLEHVENNLQELHHEMEHLKGTAKDNQDSLQKIHQETKDCLGREDLEYFKNISLAGQQELESSLNREISGVISLLETGGIDECSEGSHSCSDYETCTDKFYKYECLCSDGFARNGSSCKDIDECTQGSAAPKQHAGTQLGVTAAHATHLSREMDEPVLVLLVLHRMVQIVMTSTSAPKGRLSATATQHARTPLGVIAALATHLSKEMDEPVLVLLVLHRMVQIVMVRQIT
ncbi:uncharacterized protein [Macrobrachium rosenbergii]|uniref:uncharacterized protein isoform X2 n=1 Tax=Macrobrachium rosenbergii TaxID=79674 RepID=UPI0034D725C8